MRSLADIRTAAADRFSQALVTGDWAGALARCADLGSSHPAVVQRAEEAQSLATNSATFPGEEFRIARFAQLAVEAANEAHVRAATQPDP